jgi:hypothetical protein
LRRRKISESIAIGCCVRRARRRYGENESTVVGDDPMEFFGESIDVEELPVVRTDGNGTVELVVVEWEVRKFGDSQSEAVDRSV